MLLVNGSERKRMEELSAQIQIEQDRDKFMHLIDELNALLAYKDARLEAKDGQN
jgi:hypothetical protein